MADKVFGLDFTNQPTPTGTMSISVYNGSTLVDVELQNLHKALTQATSAQAGTVELASNAEVTAGTDTSRAITPAGLASVIAFFEQGTMWNGKFVVTVTSNNITVALKTLAGNNPSATDPVYVRIGDNIRPITAALSVTKNAGTNWFNAGGAEMAANEIDYFIYLGYNATDGVVIGFSRIPYGTRYDSFSATTTSELYCAISTITTAAASDYYQNVGRFAASLSAAAGHNWSVPTFTADNMINRPIYETRFLTWTPAYSANGSMTYTSVTTDVGRYKLIGKLLFYHLRATGTTGGTANSELKATLPWDALRSQPPGAAFTVDGTTVLGFAFVTAATPDLVTVRKYDVSNYGLGAGRTIAINSQYEVGA